MINGAKIYFGLYDNSIDTDTKTAETSSISPFCASLDKVINGQDYQRLTYLENDYFSLDGSHAFPSANNKYNIGYVSQGLSNNVGIINEYVVFVFSNTHSTYGYQFYFEPSTIPPIDFNISFYDTNGVLLGKEEIRNNTKYSLNTTKTLLNFKSVRIDFYKVAPKQRARIMNIVLGFNATYTEDLLMSVSASRTTDLVADNTNAGEISFTFYNQTFLDVFTIKDFPIDLKDSLKIVSFFKDVQSGEYKEFGTYYSNATQITDNGQVITINGYDELYSLNSTIFKKGTVYPTGRSLGDWAREVAEDCGLDLTIDQEFDTIISKGYISEVSHREALRMIAEAGCGYLYVDNTGQARLSKLKQRDLFILTQDDIEDETLDVDDGDVAQGLEITSYLYSASKSNIELAHIEEVLLTDKVQEIEIVYGKYPVYIESIQIHTQPVAMIIKQEIYSDRCVVHIKSANDNEAITFITITGSDYTTAKNITRYGSNKKNIKKIDTNTLITGNIADEVASYQVAMLLNKYKYSANIVSDKIFELGDDARLDEYDITITDIVNEISNENNTQIIKGVDKNGL